MKDSAYRAAPSQKRFPQPIVTSDLAPKIKLRNHGRGRDSAAKWMSF
jgi:hypothetical protein